MTRIIGVAFDSLSSKASIPVPRQHHQLQELEYGRHHRSHISHGGSVQNFADTRSFIGLHQAEAEQLLLRPAAGIKFDGQSNQLEQGNDDKNSNGDPQEFIKKGVKEKSREQDSLPGITGKLRDRK